MLEALQHSLEEECEGRRAETQGRADAQERCSAADEHLSKLEWESKQATVSLQRKVTFMYFKAGNYAAAQNNSNKYHSTFCSVFSTEGCWTALYFLSACCVCPQASPRKGSSRVIFCMAIHKVPRWLWEHGLLGKC